MVHPIGTITLQSNQTVYVAPGAIVKGTFKTAIGANNVKIMGRGIITGKGANQPFLVSLRNTTNSTVEGVTLVESNNWTLPVFGGSGSVIDGIKIVTFNHTADGIDIVGAQSINIKNCFIMTKDDCIAIKSGAYYQEEDKNILLPLVNGAVNNVTIQDCVIFNGIDGNALEIGCELNNNVSNVTFNNISIIHALCPCSQDEGVLSINNHGNFKVSNVIYRNIYVEDMQRYFLNIKVQKSIFSPGGSEYKYGSANHTFGYVENVNYENIYLIKTDAVHSAFISDGGSRISGIKFKNLKINNLPISNYSTNWDDRYSNQLVLVLNGASVVTPFP